MGGSTCPTKRINKNGWKYMSDQKIIKKNIKD